MEELFVRPRARQRMHEGPLGQHIDAFIRKLAETRYAVQSPQADQQQRHAALLQVLDQFSAVRSSTVPASSAAIAIKSAHGPQVKSSVCA